MLQDARVSLCGTSGVSIEEESEARQCLQLLNTCWKGG